MASSTAGEDAKDDLGEHKFQTESASAAAASTSAGKAVQEADSEWEESYVSRASIQQFRQGSMYANLILKASDVTSAEFSATSAEEESRSWNMVYLKVSFVFSGRT